jgi:hypothetical protein
MVNEAIVTMEVEPTLEAEIGKANQRIIRPVISRKIVKAPYG